MGASPLPLILLLFPFVLALVGAQASFSWRTLSGNPPFVIAKGGFSGLFPSSSSSAYQLAVMLGLPDLVLWCDVQLTKDSVGICSSSLDLTNTTNIDHKIFPGGQTSYTVNGVPVRGWFPIDYTWNDLVNVSLVQGIYSRTEIYDGLYPIEVADEVNQKYMPPGYWLNIQHDIFYKQHNLSMGSYVLGVLRTGLVDYISSPEVGFLRSISTRTPSWTKLIFRFLGSSEIEPSLNQTYGSILANLTFVKTFASGILIPKTYIWPVTASMYLLPHTNIVVDAHREGLEVYASDFVNDVAYAYNYSFDPVAEVLSFIDNSQFSVDGVLTDFPVSSSEAIACYANISRSSSRQDGPVVISHNGASGDYPGSTNLAYQKAVDDGADIIDCSVQMTSDGIPICLNSIDLSDGTNAPHTSFRTRLIRIPQIQTTAGIFSFNLTWEEIRSSLRPSISNPFLPGYNLRRNPAFSEVGEFLTLSDFLAFAKNQSVSGILLKIKHAVYLAESQGLDVINVVLRALNSSGLSNQTRLAVTIGSDDSSVLTKLKQQSRYRLLYEVDELIRDADNSTVQDIKKFADYVSFKKESVFAETNAAFLTGVTDLVHKLHAFNLPVYAELFRNEFVSQAWDFYSDPYVEINNYVVAAGVDGIITDFPATAGAYKRNSCTRLGSKSPVFTRPVPPGGLLQLGAPGYVPPAAAPLPFLTDANVSEPPFPPIVQRQWPGNTVGTSSPPPSSPPRPLSAVRHVSVSICMPILIFLLSSLLLS